ncbi:phosphate system positive regulatory protein pho81 [Rhizophlyctis rosea]|nr:phosphate system positive regulatory protein pho81 [Rhizophlyctis rosea]
MKFGKYIQAQQVDWAGPQFMNYKGLKKIINSVEPVESHPTFTTLAAVNPPGVTTLNDEPSQEFQALKTAFFFNLERELEKVNAFYLQKEAEFKVRLRTLIDKKRILQNRQGPHVQGSLANLKEGFLQFQHDLTKLQIFVEVNATGFRKILKKWDKRAKSTTKELYLSRQIEIQPCFNNEVLSDLQDQASSNFAELDTQLENQGTGNIVKSVETPSRSDAVEDVETELTKALAVKNVGAVKEFLQRRKSVIGGSGVPAEDDESLSRAFFRFCGDSSLDCLKLLLATEEVNINFTDDVNDRSYLHESAVAGRLDVMETCAGLGANIQAVDVYGRQPLHYAAMFGRPECALFLISRGAPVDALDHDGCTPLVYSITGGHTRCAQIFIDNGAAVESLSPIAPIPLSLACQHGQKDIVTLLLSKGAKLTANADGLFPLHLTSREGHHEISQLLIDHGAGVDAKDTLNGWTPIFYSASEGHLECARVLINAGCQIAVKDESDWLPWTYALYRGHISVAKLLAVPNGGEASMQLVKAVDTGIKPMAPSGLFVAEDNGGDIDMDDIPDLSLPPPIIPFRI